MRNSIRQLREKILSPRLSALAAFVRVGATVCDVGTDHAFLPCFLAKNGWDRIYASDINEKPLDRARSQIEKYGLSDRITLIQSDGLLNIPPCDDVIIAGMGGELIAEIAEKIPFKNQNLRLILQPMTHSEDLRLGLRKAGFEILTEKIVSEKRETKTYTIIYARYTGKGDKT